MRFLLYSEALRPIWRALAPLLALYLYVRHFRGPRFTAKETLTGPGASYTSPAVYVNWHRHLQYLLIHHGRRRRWLLISPAPYMLPIHVLVRRLGFRLVPGTTGYRGQQAIRTLAGKVRAGGSAMMAVDGPAGPVEVVKPGCVLLAKEAGVPVIPVAFGSRRGYCNEKRWDRMAFAVANDDVNVVYGEPVFVGDLTVEEATLRIGEGLRKAAAEVDELSVRS